MNPHETAASDQLTAVVREAAELAAYHAALIRDKTPPELAHQLTVNFQWHRYGWEPDPDQPYEY